jgi:hypothetical protein
MKSKFLIYTSTICICLSGSGVLAQDEPFRLENEHVNFLFNPKTFGLTGMIDKATGARHIYVDAKESMLWELDFQRGASTTSISNKSSKPAFTLDASPDGTQILSITWDSISWWRDNDFAKVHVKISLPKDSGIAEWRIDVDNRNDLWGLWAVKFPYVKGFLKTGEYDVAVPGQNGGLNHKKLAGPETRRYPSGPWPAQFLCGTKGSDSFYISAMDPDSRVKEFMINPGLDFYINVFPENMGVAGSDAPDHFPFAFGVYQGDWQKACKLYRSWALKQRWTSSGPLSHRKDVPEIIKNVGIWLLISNEEQDSRGFLKSNKDNTKDLVAQIEDAARKLDVPIGVHWYNWHQMPFDNDYPYFFPARPGIKEAFKDLTSKGVLIMPYINGMIADYDNSDIESFLPHSTKDEYGVPKINLWGTQSGRMLIMCPSQKFWHDKILAVVDTLYRELNVNGVYIDQVSAHPAEFCFDRSHEHTLGGGTYWVEGYRNMMSKIKKYAAPRGLAITSEDVAEPYMDMIDGYLTWQTIEEDIPMMEMVYSGYTLYFGSRAEFLPDEMFNMIEGRTFLWGHQNGWMATFYLQQGQEKKAEFMKKIGKYRVATREFLAYGELLNLVKPTNNVPVIHGSFGSSGGKWVDYPAFMGSVWKSENGNIGVYIVNTQENENTLEFVLDLKEYSQAARFKVYQVTQDGKRNFLRRTDSGLQAFSERIEPSGIKVLELEPVK